MRVEHIQEVLACPCGEHVVTAPAPPRVFDKCLYTAAFIAHIVVAKCGDSMPLYRLEKRFARLAIPISRSTMTDLFHRAAELLYPIYVLMLAIVAQAEVVLADETPMKMQRRTSKGFFWVFLGALYIVYRFSASRSGQTPTEVLGGTVGTLVVDAYTGYNAVTTVEGRERAGCLAHCRRKFFDAKEKYPEEAQHALDLILEVYRVEHEAKARRIVRTPEHLALRQTRSRDAMTRMHTWLEEQQDRHTPKGALGSAIRYMLNQWVPVTRFLDNVQVPVDNNRSEAALRVVALGRNNFLFVGHEAAGKNIAVIYSIVASCEALGVDPNAYIADVLMRIQSHPNADIAELLPHRWVAPT